MDTKEALDKVRDKIAKNAYTHCNINYENKQITFYYNCRDHALLALIEASQLFNKVIYEKIYTWREYYRIIICFETVCKIENEI